MNSFFHLTTTRRIPPNPPTPLKCRQLASITSPPISTGNWSKNTSYSGIDTPFSSSRSPLHAAPQGFSQTFLDTLTGFTGTLCLITGSLHIEVI
ncbi:hypothetical protein [Microcoleus sp. FACHB-68]|uniref:hypothetical protein n=1 Tax=Microcoleus sp. FACHB-68 TaxID=2692826 RepID=UPI0016864C6B|nr:hypothetical protein [Microcoleus sp. FACHB-68]MBD1937724.1 hypothetical protein [Microcoleus sp. FACHB-68]